MPSDYVNPFQTQLSPEESAAYRRWVKNNNVPSNNSPLSDYDMQGFYKGLMSGHPRAQTEMQADGMHFTDYWKTPYHESFSNESKYANDSAPHWVEQPNVFELVKPDGNLKYMEMKAPPLEERVRQARY